MTTLERLTDILVKHYKLDATRIAPDEPLEQLGIDSLGMVELLFFIEDEFKLQLPADAPLLATVSEAVRYIDGLLQAGTGAPGTPAAVPDSPPRPPP
ncbi:MAG TPA: phosphopantetheine-binding protein [Steroidobacteraceae bacterium]|jgi:acyl carrier protein|nr:phosphopantetheine-binding protein [Steroidobacteraceae bacterium]